MRCTGVAVRHFQTQFHAPGSFPLLESPGAGLSASPPIEKVTVPAKQNEIHIHTYNRGFLFTLNTVAIVFSVSMLYQGIKVQKHRIITLKTHYVYNCKKSISFNYYMQNKLQVLILLEHSRLNIIYHIIISAK